MKGSQSAEEFMRRLQVHPVVFIGCIGPIVLCVFIALVIYFAIFKPYLPVFYNNEFHAVLENYEEVRSAVFRNELPVSALEQVATGYHLEWLQAQYQNPTWEFPPITNSPELMWIRERTDSCAIVSMNHYYDRFRVAFILRKIDNTWKVERQTQGYNAGVAGSLPLEVCN